MATTAQTARFLQLHLLTFYPPANLNRDDTGRPKSAVIGGEARLRVSSQALKRAWRTSDVFAKKLDGHRGERTQRLGAVLEAHLLSKGTSAGDARAIAREIAGAFGKVKSEKDDNPTYTEQLAFVSPEERAAAIAFSEARAAKTKDAPDKKALVLALLRKTDTAADIAMFGRMLADAPEFNREAAVAVSHAFTTHRVAIEDDYYTAVDDLKRPSEDAGAGFVGEAGFGSGVFYLYICVDRELLGRNLDGNAALTGTAIEALLEAAAQVGPSGKRASYASFARTSFILVEKGDAAPRTLAAAFVRPIGAERGVNDYLAASVHELRATREKFERAYGAEGVRTLEMNCLDPSEEGTATLAELVRFACEP
ncbi:type I-E CRISPR-associated protein Cas7/Cse4/CasC [Rhodoplanes roseus]|uniref:Type I-E CRISPR-associated protein Cas7/Cse4/CasC n=1 Tax=Rhodoplanes roseus TaxID=29409 RepID=A0A327KV09_9BRAD|nr:type I-E CRISPR-associated protein Cas7/Cse4/CasC [Rhodoplanes roseus]RAI42740.1 type I-E CRISPR-associated protein Cas7/Cse4/CasC [Rhodoplanes roseus]